MRRHVSGLFADFLTWTTLGIIFSNFSKKTSTRHFYQNHQSLHRAFALNFLSNFSFSLPMKSFNRLTLIWYIDIGILIKIFKSTFSIVKMSFNVNGCKLRLCISRFGFEIEEGNYETLRFSLGVLRLKWCFHRKNIGVSDDAKDSRKITP